MEKKIKSIRTSSTKDSRIARSLLFLSFAPFLSSLLILLSVFYCRIQIGLTFSNIFYIPLYCSLLAIVILFLYVILKRDYKRLLVLIPVVVLLTLEFIVFLSLKSSDIYYLHFSIRQLLAGILMCSVPYTLLFRETKNKLIFILLNIILFSFAVTATTHLNYSRLYNRCSIQSVQKQTNENNSTMFQN